MLKDEEFDSVYKNMRGQISALSRNLIKEYCKEANMSEDREKCKTYIVRSLIYGASLMVGVFYRSPAENAAPFVQVGDTVQKGDVLGAVEAMKLINEIIAEQNGIVAEVCAENNSVVDFGHILFRLRKGRE